MLLIWLALELDLLIDVHNKCGEKYGAVRLRRTDPLVLFGKSRYAWDEIYDYEGSASWVVVSCLVVLTYLEIHLQLLYCML